MVSAKRTIAGYLIAQSVAVSIWWLVLFFYPPSIFVFQPADWPADYLLSFCLPDVVFAVVGSLVAAFATMFEKRWAGIALWGLACAIGYAALTCLGVSITTDSAWFASALMVVMAGATLAMATMFGTHTNPQLFRTGKKSPIAACGWTLFQTAIFWSVFLWIIPRGIDELMHRFVRSTGFFEPLPMVGGGVFMLASALGIWSGMTMAVQGLGTPLPTSNAPKLVVAGPYRWVRNPMAVAGIAQGIAIGFCHGSGWVIAYAITGGLLWHFTVRIAEEEELRLRFGEDYEIYRRHVGLWLPGNSI